MAPLVTCPACEATLKLLAEPTPGKKVKCPKCAAIFAPEDGKSRRVTAERPAATAPAWAPPPPGDEEEADGRDREDGRPRRPRPEQGGNRLLIGLLVGGAVLAPLLLVCGGVAGYALSRGAWQAGRDRGVQAPVAQQNAAGQGNVAAAAPAQPNPAGPENFAAAPIPAPEPNPPAQPIPAPPAGDEAPGVYGDQGGEEVAPADPSLPDTLLRARAGDTFYKVSNPRVGMGFGRVSLTVDFEVVKEGEYKGFSLVVHGDDGSRATAFFLGPLRSHGTLEVSQSPADPFGGPFSGIPADPFDPFPRMPVRPFGAAFPQNLEVYLTRGEGRYGPPAPTFKVSNSAIMGKMTRLTQARNWTKEEIARLSQPPPNYTNPNAHPDVGQDTPFVGNSTGGGPLRYVEPDGNLYGLDYRTGEWDGEKCLGGLVPVFKRDQPTGQGTTRVMAREGYAVGAAKVRSKRYVDAVQLVFMRGKPDGRLDPADSYTSDWFGTQGEQEAKTLAGDGTPVIGIHCRQGAILDALALVLRKG